MGRSNNGIVDFKGIIGNVILNGTVFIYWQMYVINLDNLFLDFYEFCIKFDDNKK